jgi:hypothetical protein
MEVEYLCERNSLCVVRDNGHHFCGTVYHLLQMSEKKDKFLDSLIENKSWMHHDPELEHLSGDEYQWRQLWCSVNDVHHVLHPSDDYTWPPCALMVTLHDKTKQFHVAVKLKSQDV